ncbi:MAG: CRISPR-associated endonuclease Cas1, partial [Candidatus Moranbacteria bacterium]|nr:CRISPR-associated endonuclease Cas1 [Candidatus Moranbacteria bacterium]
LESEGHELVVTTPGAFLGKTKSCIVVKHRGKKTNEVKTTNLNHIFVTGRGVTVSSNVIEFCSERHIPIDYIRFDGKPYARLYSFYDQNARIQLAQLAACGNEKGSAFAKSIVYGKIKNQLNLAKYYHKYRKEKDSTFSTLFREKTSRIELHLKELGETNDSDHDILRGKLFSIEGRAAQNYWEITKRLLAGMLVFEGREGKGATDVVNSMLNYGYGILQAKVWDAVIRSSLSPFISFLHKPQRNKPTFIFDLIEQFRVQAVDRVIFSMINKGVEVTMEKERLSNKTKTRLIGHILERMNTYEKYRGRRIRFVEIIREQARGAALYFTGETKKYLPYIGKW